MKRIVLERLTLRNFKGFREFTLQANGGAADVYGDNATGKTTIFDAFSWLLFGKDSTNRTDFEIKELDSTGKVRQHKLEHEVEGVLIVDGRRKSFRRVYAEKWTKKRGSITESFEGHETAYYVDGVPSNKRDYEAEIKALINEDLFKLITSPTYFNEQLKWEQRRALLLEICGDVTDAEVIHSNKELAPLESILREREIDAHKKIVAASMKRINQEIKDIPVRISEAQRSMPDTSDLSQELLQEDLDMLRARVSDKEQELLRIQSGGQTAVLKRQVAEIDSKQLQIKTLLQTAALDAVAQQRAHVNELQRGLDNLRRSIDDRQYKIRANEQRIAGLDQERAHLRAEYAAVNAEPFAHTADDNCPACGQMLPEMRRQEAQEKALAEFNRVKSQRLEAIQRRGHSAKDESERLAAEIEQLQSRLVEGTEQQQMFLDRLQAAEQELERLRSNVQDPSSDVEYRRLQEDRTAICNHMDELEQSTVAAQQQLRESISGLRQEIVSYESELAKFEQVTRQQERIAELEQQESKLAAEYEQLQRELYLMEEFTRTKVSLLQARIDSKFKIARFRLFDEQVNGGLRETCETLSGGVPYDKGLNNAARINVGLDIINTLSQHYGVSAPIFVDNAEAVTQLIDVNAQIIRLVVPPAFINLPKEMQDQLTAVHGGRDKAADAWAAQNKRLRIETTGDSFREAI